MKAGHRPLAAMFALMGVTACVLALSRFLLNWAYNGLAWRPGLTARDHYLAVGHSYAEGFVVGFFLAFFLVVLAVVVSSWAEDRRGRARPVTLDPLARTTTPVRAITPAPQPTPRP